MANDYYKAYKRQRKTWDMNPVERVKQSAKNYKRAEAKEEAKEYLNEFYEEMEDTCEP